MCSYVRQQFVASRITDILREPLVVPPGKAYERHWSCGKTLAELQKVLQTMLRSSVPERFTPKEKPIPCHCPVEPNSPLF